MKKLTLTLALILASVGAAQAEAILVSKNVSGDLTYVYSNTLKVKGNARAAWVLTSYKNPLKGQVYSDKAYTVFDCAGMRSGHTTITYYSERNGSGRVLLTDDRGTQMKQAVPDTVGEEILQAVCAL